MQRLLVLLAVVAMILAGVSFSEAQTCPGSRRERLARVQADLETALADQEVRRAPSVEKILAAMVRDRRRDQHRDHDCATLFYAAEVHDFLQTAVGGRCRSTILHWLLASDAEAAYGVMWHLPPLRCGQVSLGVVDVLSRPWRL